LGGIGPEDELIEQTKENRNMGQYSMKVSDYFQYLEQRRSVRNDK